MCGQDVLQSGPEHRLCDRERNELRAAAHAAEGEQELLLRELASTEHRLRSLQARDVITML